MSISKKKNLGQGMKPRGNQAETEKAEEPVSADEGQEETSVEAVSEAQEVEQTPNNLEPEFEVDRIDLYVASPDPSKYTLIDSIATKDETVDLRKLLYDSGEGEPEVQRLPEEKSDAQKQAEQLLVQNLDAFPTEADIANHPLRTFKADSKKLRMFEGFESEGARLTYEGLGQQSDGSFKLVLAVDEGYIESIRQEAEANSMTPEQWCSQQFNFFLESWWAKPKGR